MQCDTLNLNAKRLYSFIQGCSHYFLTPLFNMNDPDSRSYAARKDFAKINGAKYNTLSPSVSQAFV